MLRLGISGVCGKMGKRIASLAMKDPGVEIKGALERPDISDIGEDLGLIIGAKESGVKITSSLEEVSGMIDCLIEFTSPEATMKHLEVCAKKGISMVIGTTGLDEKALEAIAEKAKKVPIVFSPNMSVGVNLLFNLVEEASRVLGRDFSIKIDETHHVHKKDSPSGTAKMIKKVIAASSGIDAPIEAFREGEVIGNHGVVFDGKYETLEIRHDAKNRDVFASGAIEAAKFTAGKAPALYSMKDVLGLKNK